MSSMIRSIERAIIRQREGLTALQMRSKKRQRARAKAIEEMERKKKLRADLSPVEVQKIAARHKTEVQGQKAQIGLLSRVKGALRRLVG